MATIVSRGQCLDQVQMEYSFHLFGGFRFACAAVTYQGNGDADFVSVATQTLASAANRNAMSAGSVSVGPPQIE